MPKGRGKKNIALEVPREGQDQYFLRQRMRLLEKQKIDESETKAF